MSEYNLLMTDVALNPVLVANGGNIDMNGRKVINVGSPTNNGDAVNKEYVDQPVDSDLDMNGFKIVELGSPTNNTDGANKEYVDNTVSNYVPLAGGTMTGKLGVQSVNPARGIIQAGPRAPENNNMTFDVDCPFVANSTILNTTPGSTPFLLFSRPGENFVTYDTTGMFTVNHYENVAASKTELGIDLYEDDMIPGVVPVNVLKLRSNGEMDIIGPLNLDDQNITGVSLPVGDTDVANKIYVDNKFGEIGNGELDMHNFKIVNLGSPTNNTDAANKEYVDKPVDSDLDMNGFKITELGLCTNNTDAANKEYVDGFLPLTGGTLSSNSNPQLNVNTETVNDTLNTIPVLELSRDGDGSIQNNKCFMGVGRYEDSGNNARSKFTMALKHTTEVFAPTPVFELQSGGDVFIDGPLHLKDKRIIGVDAPIDNTDVANKEYVDDKFGEIGNGELDMHNFKIVNVGLCTNNGDAANKEYVDKPVDSDLDMNGFKINELGMPVQTTDATSKQYVDNNFVNLTGDIMSGRLGVEVTDPIQGILQVGNKHIGTSNMLLDNNCPIVANLEIANNPLGRSPIVCLNRSGVQGQIYGNVALFALGRYENVGSNSRSSLGLGLAHGEITPGSTLTEVITFKSSGEIDMIGPLNLDTKRITGVDLPVDNNDAANKEYVDKPVDSDLDMNGFKIIELGNPVNDTDAVNKQYVDSYHPLPALEYNLDNLSADGTIMYNVGSSAGQYNLDNVTPWELMDGKLYSDGTSQYSGLVDFEVVGGGLNFQFFFVCQFLKNRNEKSLNDYTVMFEYQQIRLAVPFRYDENNNTWEINYKYGNANEFSYSSTGVFYNDEVVLWSVRQNGTSLKVMASTVSGTKTLISENLSSYTMSGDDNLVIGGGSLTATDFPSFFFYHLSTYPRSMSDKLFSDIRNKLSAEWIGRYPSGRTNDYICDQLISQNVNAFSYNYIDFYQDPTTGIEYTFIQPGLEHTFNCYLTGRYSVSIYFSGLSTGFGDGVIFLSRDGVILGAPEVNTIFANFTVPTGAMDNRQAIISVNDDLQLFSGSNYGVMIWFNANGTFDGRATFKIKYNGPMGPVSYY